MKYKYYSLLIKLALIMLETNYLLESFLGVINSGLNRIKF